jgi:hypothetical protein
MNVLDSAGNILYTDQAPAAFKTTAATTTSYHLVISTTSESPVGYRLNVDVPPLPGEATRIEIGPDADAAVVTGELPSGGDMDTWVIRGEAGDTLTLELQYGTAIPVRPYVYNDAGELISLNDSGGYGSRTATTLLETTGDVRIVVVSHPDESNVNYTLTVGTSSLASDE